MRTLFAILRLSLLPLAAWAEIVEGIVAWMKEARPVVPVASNLTGCKAAKSC